MTGMLLQGEQWPLLFAATSFFHVEKQACKLETMGRPRELDFGLGASRFSPFSVHDLQLDKLESCEQPT